MTTTPSFERGSISYDLAAAHRLIDIARIDSDPEVGVVSDDAMQAVVVATELRRIGISTLTFYSGKIAKQVKKATEANIYYILYLNPDGYRLKDVTTNTFYDLPFEGFAKYIMDGLVSAYTFTYCEAHDAGMKRLADTDQS